ncbi:hypothetical protein Tco_0681913 [Tanacetum coccineum]|uniref:Reverse transcriptase domain-containing protein n=1 Tax=Tanacetum coccineum TaxID=301880 RepID=A0ABQ4XPY4_9ASTR
MDTHLPPPPLPFPATKFINGPLSVILEAFGEISSYKLIELIAQGIEARAIRTGFLGHSLRKSGLVSETTKSKKYYAHGNSTLPLNPIVDTTSPTLTPFEGSDFILEEIEAKLSNTSYKSGIDDAEYDPEEDILLLEAILNSDPLSPLPNHANYFPGNRKELKNCEAKTDKTSIDEPPEVELKDLPPHLEYAFLEGDNKLPVIIAKDLSVGEKAALIKVLQSHKRAIAWKLFDIKGINPEFCTHKILLEEDYTPAVQHQSHSRDV